MLLNWSTGSVQFFQIVFVDFFIIILIIALQNYYWHSNLEHSMDGNNKMTDGRWPIEYDSYDHNDLHE